MTRAPVLMLSKPVLQQSNELSGFAVTCCVAHSSVAVIDNNKKNLIAAGTIRTQKKW